MTRKLAHLVAASIAAVALGLTGCSSGDSGSSPNGSSDGEIDALFNMPTGSPQEQAMNDLIAKFEEEEGIKVNVVYASTTFEDDMKVKMASDSIPDVFSTHGWSVLRYGPYLEPLNDQPWAEFVNPGLKNVMYDEEGNIFALPLEYGTTGMLVNYDLLEHANIDAEKLTTWDDFNAAMQTLKDELGITPFTASGKDSNAGDIGNFLASGNFTEEQKKQFQDGTFDPALWQEGVTDLVELWQKEGYFNPDFVSASLDDMSRQLADGSAAFALSWPFVVNTAYEYNPEANLGFIPIPGIEEPYLVGGEGVSAFGVSKTAQNKDAAIAFVNFLAEPENAEPLLDSMGAYSGLTNVEVDLGEMQPSFDMYVAPGDVPTQPFFDRVYLPNGMWNSIITTTDGVINGQMSSSEASEQMKAQFDTLYGQQ